MTTILLILISAGTGWIIAYSKYTDPKHIVGRYWKEIFKLAEQIGKCERLSQSNAGIEPSISSITNHYKKKKDEAGNIVNSVLSYHYGDAEDEEEKQYVFDHRYLEKRKEKIHTK